MKRFFSLSTVLLVASFFLLSACSTTGERRTAVADGTRSEVALLETTDLHTNVLSYDYFRLTEDKTVGFERVATLITQARKEFANTLLFDNGDTIQGTALSDYQAQVNPLPCGQVLAIDRKSVV